MDVNDAARIFQGLLETTRILRGFHLAGGEPFLDFDRLLAVQKLAVEFGIPIEYVETNASWCSDLDIARDRFVRLREAGLRCILISCSPFHAERVPLERINIALEVAIEIFGCEGVILWVPEFYHQLSKIRTTGVIPLEEYVSAVGEQVATIMIRSGYSLISGGRVGYKLGNFYNRQPPEHCQGERCEVELLKSGHAHFDPYGNLIPSFCSGISLGDARDLSKLFIEFDLEKLPIVRMLVEEGPYGLYRYAVERFGYKPLPDGYVGKCHLCVDVRKWMQTCTREFRELAPAEFYNQLE
jgi:hypothetical protein